MREIAAFVVIVACVVIFVVLKPGHDKQVIVEKPIIKEVPVTKTVIKEVPKIIERKAPVSEPKSKSDDFERSLQALRRSRERLQQAEARLQRTQEKLRRERLAYPSPAPVQGEMVEPTYPLARPIVPLPVPYHYMPRPPPAFVVRLFENGRRYMPRRPPVYRYRPMPMGRPVYRYGAPPMGRRVYPYRAMPMGRRVYRYRFVHRFR